ncbi:MAG: hypothetical protein RI563_06600 [Thiohalophilus sp.]|uniref:putative iron-sulfur cluster-binding metallochaperone n=1 Tax=Thiohalophilus sp. TaxID=3028392 RepID=UPI0028709D73|nr:hypothetical protein [Thiohalophilus sp.]MDR9436531.1 hypothetical protein [Thiohalophilus sp.]
MTDCTDDCHTPSARRYVCPRNGKRYSAVSTTTLLHHLQHPWLWDLSERRYYFCSDPDCPVIYFADDDSVIEQAELRTPVGLKDPSDEALICHCFGVTRAQASDPSVKVFVQQQTREGTCACQIRNPAGRCCLTDFPAS